MTGLTNVPTTSAPRGSLIDAGATVPILAGVRIAIGAALLARPDGLARAFGLDAGAASAGRPLARMTGAREIAIGVGTLQAWRRGEATDGWVAAQAVSDGADAVLFAAAARRHTVPAARGWGMAAFALSGALSEAWTAWRIRVGG